jgi:hypothetical protein
MEIAPDVSDTVSEFYVVTSFSGDHLGEHGFKI